MVLAQHTAGRLTGVDLFPLFIELFNQNACFWVCRTGFRVLLNRWIALFKDEELDLIWSEGAIYHIGFQRDWLNGSVSLKTGALLP